MNLSYNQASFENRIPGLPPASLRRQFSRAWQFEAAPVRVFSDLQKEQVVTIAVGGLASPIALKDLRLLREEEARTEEPITPHAFFSAEGLLEYVHVILGARLPRPVLVPDGEGGIRIEWSSEDRIVRVIVPPEVMTNGYIYRRVAGVSQIIPSTRATVLQTLRTVILAA